MASKYRHLLILSAVSIIVFFTNLGGPKLWDRDEPRNAGCALEMMQANDWIVPRFNQQLRSHKPVLLYWLMISSYSVFGVSEFSARFSSAILGVLTVLLTYDIGRRLFGNIAALWAGLVLSTTVMFTVASRAATPDSPLIFSVILGLWLYVLFSFEQSEDADVAKPRYYPRHWWQVMLVYAAFGLAVLSKGPIGLILPTAIMGMFLLIHRLSPLERTGTWRDWVFHLLRPFNPVHFIRTVGFMRPLLAVTACAIVSVPWYLQVASRDFNWITGFFFEHNFNRAITAFEGHSGPPFYYMLAICIGFFPWSVFFAPMIWDLTKNLHRESKERAGLIFCSCWALVWLIAFSIAQTKLPSYITPMYPALALLFGVFVRRVSEQRLEISKRWLDMSMSVTVVVGALMVIGLVVVSQMLLPGEEILALLGVLLIAGGAVAWSFKANGKPRQAVVSFMVMSFVFCTLSMAWAGNRISKHQNFGRLVAKIDQQQPSAHLCSFGVMEASWVFYSKRPVNFVDADWQELQRIIASHDDVIILSTEERLDRMPEEMRSQLTEVAREQYFLKDYSLIAFRPNPQLVEIARSDTGKTSR